MKLVLKVKKQKLKGGLGDKAKLSDFDAKEVKIGIAVEMEHTNSKAIAKEIVADHLSEDPHYYSKLKAAKLEEEDISEAKAPAKAKYKSGFNKEPGKHKQPKNKAGPQGIPSGKNFPFTQKSGRLWKIKAAAKKGPVVAVGAAGITEENKET